MVLKERSEFQREEVDFKEGLIARDWREIMNGLTKGYKGRKWSCKDVLGEGGICSRTK